MEIFEISQYDQLRIQKGIYAIYIYTNQVKKTS